MPTNLAQKNRVTTHKKLIWKSMRSIHRKKSIVLTMTKTFSFRRPLKSLRAQTQPIKLAWKLGNGYWTSSVKKKLNGERKRSEIKLKQRWKRSKHQSPSQAALTNKVLRKKMPTTTFWRRKDLMTNRNLIFLSLQTLLIIRLQREIRIILKCTKLETLKRYSQQNLQKCILRTKWAAEEGIFKKR